MKNTVLLVVIGAFLTGAVGAQSPEAPDLAKRAAFLKLIERTRVDPKVVEAVDRPSSIVHRRSSCHEP